MKIVLYFPLFLISILAFGQGNVNSNLGAQFKGGLSALFEYIDKELVYPEEYLDSGITGRVFVQFTVERNGKLTNVRVVESLGKAFDQEALRIFNNMPKWNPGKNNGARIRQEVIQDILFKPPSENITIIDAFAEKAKPVVFADKSKPTKRKEKKRKENADRTFSEVDQNAEFLGGRPAFNAYVKKELNYPAEFENSGIQGRVYVQFIVETDGTITNETVIRSLGDAFYQEALRIIRNMPKWKPAINKRKPVRQKMVRNIYFNEAGN